jgi:hypothetical protein
VGRASFHWIAKRQKLHPWVNIVNHSDGLYQRSLCVARCCEQAVGVKNAEQLDKVAKMARRAQRKANLMARQGEADRKSGPKLTKHLLAGKSGLGTRYHR